MATRVQAQDFREAGLLDRAAELHEPVKFHRKVWENCVIAQVFHDYVCADASVIGFGVG